jgi:hypothetical protein
MEVWYGFVGSNAHLVYYFSTSESERYMAQVRNRFAQWILDTCRRPRDEAWLDYQEEIALRHTRAKKNRTDGVDAPEHIPLRYLIAFIQPITATIRPVLARKGHRPQEVDGMHQAWSKAVTLQVALWSRPYARDGDW